jgi:hypothetical protein
MLHTVENIKEVMNLNIGMKHPPTQLLIIQSKELVLQRMSRTIVRLMQHDQFLAKIHTRCLLSRTNSLFRIPRNATDYKKKHK